MQYIRVLLQSRLDYLPAPRGMRVFESSLPGVSPGKYHPCENCRGMGRLKNKAGRLFRCLVCGGSGWRKRKKGEPVYDGYTRQKISTYDSPGKFSTMSNKSLDSEIQRLAIFESLRSGESLGEISQFRNVEKRNASGSYKELEIALAWLADYHPNLSRLLVLIYDTPLLSSKKLNPTQKIMESIAVALLAKKMRGRIYLPKWEYRKIREEKRSGIRALLKKRIPPNQIARELGVSKRYIERVKESLHS